MTENPRISNFKYKEHSVALKTKVHKDEVDGTLDRPRRPGHWPHDVREGPRKLYAQLLVQHLAYTKYFLTPGAAMRKASQVLPKL